MEIYGFVRSKKIPVRILSPERREFRCGIGACAGEGNSAVGAIKTAVETAEGTVGRWQFTQLKQVLMRAPRGG
jgi:hypothetical protein